MSNNNFYESKIKMDISEVMTSTVHSIYPDQSVADAAKLMLDNCVGSIMIQPKKGEKKPLGIITERDIVTRVVAIGKNPAKITVDEIATKPVITASPTLDVAKAMSLMAKMNIRRLIIVEENIVAGIVTYRDLLRVTPSLLEIALEYERIGFGNQRETDMIIDYAFGDYDEDSELNQKDLSLGFYCSECGQWCEGSPSNDEIDAPLCGDCINIDQNIE